MSEDPSPFSLPPQPIDRHEVSWFRAVFQGEEAMVGVVHAVFHAEPHPDPEIAEPWWEITLDGRPAGDALGWDGLRLSRRARSQDFTTREAARAFVLEAMNVRVADLRQRLGAAVPLARSFLPPGVTDLAGVPPVRSPLDVQAALHALVASGELAGVTGLRGVAGSGPLAFELHLTDGSGVRMTAERIPPPAAAEPGEMKEATWRVLMLVGESPAKQGSDGCSLLPSPARQVLLDARLIEPVPFPGVNPAHDPSGSARAAALRVWEASHRYRLTAAGTARLTAGRVREGQRA